MDEMVHSGGKSDACAYAVLKDSSKTVLFLNTINIEKNNYLHLFPPESFRQYWRYVN